jgi:thymidylate synthase
MSALYFDISYARIIERILLTGKRTMDRTNTGTLSVFCDQVRIDLKKEYPLTQLKLTKPSNIIGELLWFLSGDTTLPTLRYFSNLSPDQHTIWSHDMEKFKSISDKTQYQDDCGRIYGYQWRKQDVVDMDGMVSKHDQITTLIDNIKAVKAGNPTHARRLKVQSWNPYDHTVGDKIVAALPACHDGFQVILTEDNTVLNLEFHMRSTDVMLGLPYNIASYAALAHILAKLTGCDVGELVFSGVDIHIYANHIEGAKTVIERARYLGANNTKLTLPKFSTLDELLSKYTAKDFVVTDYKPQPFISFPQAS